MTTLYPTIRDLKVGDYALRYLSLDLLKVKVTDQEIKYYEYIDCTDNFDQAELDIDILPVVTDADDDYINPQPDCCDRDCDHLEISEYDGLTCTCKCTDDRLTPYSKCPKEVSYKMDEEIESANWLRR